MSLEKQVSEKTPKAFIWHTYEDKSVPVENSLLLVSALRKQGISTEFHMPMSYFKIIGTLLLAQGKKYVYLFMLTGSVVANILTNLITIPLWGKMGAAVSSVVSYTVAGGLFLAYYVRMYGVPVRDVFLFKPEEIAMLRGKLSRVKAKLVKK